MATANQRLGKAYIRVNGRLLESLKGAKLDIGGDKREPVIGATSVHGFSAEVKEPMVECEISMGPETSLDEIRNFTSENLTFECDTGQTYILRAAWLVDPPVATAAEGGKIPLKFCALDCEELRP